MWGRDLVQRYAERGGVRRLADINPLRAEAGKKAMGLSCPDVHAVEDMLQTTKPDASS